MNPKQKKRLIVIALLLILLSSAIGLTLYALKQNINLFYTPTELLNAQIHPQQNIRLGGYVKQGSVHYEEIGTAVTFVVTDKTHDIQVHYDGILPNLFREGQSVVVTGTQQSSHVLLAHEVLAKHDEKYMPKSLSTLSKKGDNHAA